MYDATDYTYNPYYLQPATIQRTQSDGKVLTTVNRYAYDMTQISPYNDMVAAHMISQPIEVEKQLNGVKINRTVNLYSTSWPAFPGHVLPSYLQTQKSNNPTEDRIRYQDYDGYGNASSLSYIAGPKVAYIWGYNGLYPIAKAINTSPADIGFTNCEEPLTLAQTDKSGSNMVFYSNSGAYTSYDAHTGHKSFSLTNGSGHTISTRNTLLAGKYVFSYWSKGSTPTSSTTVGLPVSFTILDQKDQTADSKGWQYHEDVVNIPTSDHFTIYPNLSGADILIDDIRIYPLGAEMTTYTYDPLVGVTSMTDARNNTTYYEYDYFHRLSNVKDQNGNIKNRYCYNYAGQSMGCQIPFVTPTPPPSPDPPVGLYFRVEISNVNNEYYGSGDNYSSFQTGDVCIKLYSNPECTIPLTLPYDIPFVLTMGDNILDDLGGDIAEPDYGIFTLIAGNSSYCLGTMDLDNISHYIGSDNNPHYQEFIYHYDLTPGSNAYRTKPTVFN
jgi:YD repeat-containing protein